MTTARGRLCCSIHCRSRPTSHRVAPGQIALVGRRKRDKSHSGYFPKQGAASVLRLKACEYRSKNSAAVSLGFEDESMLCWRRRHVDEGGAVEWDMVNGVVVAYKRSEIRQDDRCRTEIDGETQPSRCRDRA
jgi:hypothetical protein